jgi:hypothetical protein
VKGGGKGKGGETRNCYNCGKPGHLARDCRGPKGGGKGGGKHGLNAVEDEYGTEEDGYLFSIGEDIECQICQDDACISQNPSWINHGITRGQIRPAISQGFVMKNSFQALSAECLEEWPEATVNNVDTEKAKMPVWKKPVKTMKNKHKESERGMTNDDWLDDILACLCNDNANEKEEMILSVTEDGFTWHKEEAVVDSGAIDCVTSRKRFPHLRVQSTPESERGESWTCAGGKKIAKEGEVVVDWMTTKGESHKVKLKIGDIQRTLISAGKLNERGNDVVLSKQNPRIVTKKGQVIPLQQKNGMFILEMWHKVPFPRLGR